MGTETSLIEFEHESIWVVEYPVHYSGIDFRSRMTVLRLDDDTVLLHSPCDIGPELAEEIARIGEVSCIVAPGSYHYFHVTSAQANYPEAETYICPGIEQKCPDLEFDWILGDKAPDLWVDSMEQVLVRGARFMWEVAFFHIPSKTLILVDLVENIGDKTADVGLGMKIWWKLVFHMWNHPKPAPEYQLGWKDKEAARESLQRILDWDFERVILAHGDLIEENARDVVRNAWEQPLSD